MAGRDEQEQPHRLVIHHALSRHTWVIGSVLLLALLTAQAWVPLFTTRRHSLTYTNLDLSGGKFFPVQNAAGLHAGEVIQMVVAGCNTSEATLPVKIHRDLFSADEEGADGAFLEDVSGAWTPGCRTTVSQVHVVPFGVPPGRYYLRGTTYPQDGSEPVEWQSETFTVVP